MNHDSDRVQARHDRPLTVVRRGGESRRVPAPTDTADSSVTADVDADHESPPAAAASETAPDSIVPLAEEVRRILLRALELTHWNVQEASSRLGIGRATMYRKIERYGLIRESRCAPSASAISAAAPVGSASRSDRGREQEDHHHYADRRLDDEPE